jgi:hypothetical protein
MRSGSQTFSRNQYAPIFGEKQTTAFNPGAQPTLGTEFRVQYSQTQWIDSASKSEGKG